MRWLALLFVVLIAALQYPMWLGKGGWLQVRETDRQLAAQREEGLAPAHAITRAASLRFRPIMMTTLAAIMGTLPIALAHGASAELRQPLGLAVVGGLVVSQLLTLYITPSLYLYMEDLLALLRRLSGRAPAPARGPAMSWQEEGGPG